MNMLTTGVGVDALTITYGGAAGVTPISDLSFNLSPGSLSVILGPSGCGKTSVLACLAGLMKPASGRVMVDEVLVSELNQVELAEYRRGRVGVVFQSFNLVPSLTAFENVLVPLAAAKTPKAQARARVSELLKQVSLGDRMHHRPSELSGGQMQRVAIARALALDPAFVVADEPTANLDQTHVGSVIDLLKSLAKEGRCVVVATHDHRVVEVADRVIDLTPQS
jgi:putative ABC transport system ATP-binding protein